MMEPTRADSFPDIVSALRYLRFEPLNHVVTRDTVIWPTDADITSGIDGIDSLDTYELVATLEDEFGIDLIDSISMELRTIGDLARVCDQLRNPQ